MRRRLNALVGAALFALLLPGAPAVYAHAFSQPYDLPIPLWLFLIGAGAAVALTFAVLALFSAAAPGLHGYPRLNLLRFGVARGIADPVVLFVFQTIAVGRR